MFGEGKRYFSLQVSTKDAVSLTLNLPLELGFTNRSFSLKHNPRNGLGIYLFQTIFQCIYLNNSSFPQYNSTVRFF
jgi:hypothetical protein